MSKPKFEWEVRVTWHFPKSEQTISEVVAQFVAIYDANLCAKMLQSICKNKDYTVHKIGEKK